MTTRQLAATDPPAANRWLRLAGIAGIVFLLTFLVQFVAGPQGPAFTAAPGEIRDYYARHQSGVELSALMTAGFAVVYGVFLAGIWGTLRRTPGLWLATLGLVAGVSSSIMLLVGHAINVALASYLAGTPGADPAVVPLFKTANLLTMLFNTVAVGLAVLTLSAGMLLSGEYGGRVRWIAWAGAVAGALFLVSAAAVFNPVGPAQVPSLLGLPIWLVWVGGVSVRLARGVTGLEVPHAEPTVAPSPGFQA